MSIPRVPEPVSTHPSARSRSLEDWLALPAHANPRQRATRLQEIAWRRGADVAAASASMAVGGTAILLGIFWSILSRALAPVIWLTIAGAVLILIGALVIHRARTRLPKSSPRIVRGPVGTVAGIVWPAVLWGIIAVLVMWSALSTPSHIEDLWPKLFGMLFFLALFLASALTIPAIVLGRAEASLRRLCAGSPRYRALLDHDRATWHPEYGEQLYGPL